MKFRWAEAALAAALLSGCASVTTGVSASGKPGEFAAGGERTYEVARTDAQASQAGYQKVEALVREELARRGLNAQPAGHAHYRLTIAYATQPAAVALTTPACGGEQAPCIGVDGPAPLALPFAGTVYRHVLTLRFIDAKSGADAYRVSAAVQDREPDPLQAAPTLVRSALAQVPFSGAGGWLVKTKKDDAGGMPGVVSVAPADATR
jgi:hypothetical protein